MFCRHLTVCQVLLLLFPMLPVVSNCQTFTWGRRGGSLVSAWVLFSCFRNYPLSLELWNLYSLQYPCAGVLDLVARTSVGFCFVYWDEATPYKHELVTIGVELSCFFLWIQLIYAVAWVRYVCVCVCVCARARARVCHEKVVAIQNRVN